MSNKIEKDFVIGGSVERALSGDYELSAAKVLGEAWQLTIKHFLSFTPAIVAMIALQATIFIVALDFQLGDASVLLDILDNPDLLDANILQSLIIANLSFEVISAPIFASLSLMSMSHAAGLNSKFKHITKGFQFTIPVMLVTLLGLVLQGIASSLVSVLSLYLSLAFTHSVLLVCDKKMNPLMALWTSLRAVNKKLLPLLGIFVLIGIMLAFAAAFFGIGLIVVLPFYFHVKGVLYRIMFGVTVKVVADAPDDNDRSNDDNDNSDDNDDADQPPRDHSDNGHRPGSQTFDA